MNWEGFRMRLLLSIFALVTLIAGCGDIRSQTKEKNTIKIGVTAYDQYDVFIAALLEEFTSQAAVKSADTKININIEIYNAAGSQTVQNSQIKEMIDDGCDVVCVNLVDRMDTVGVINLEEEYNIPIIFFNRELVEEDLSRSDNFYYVGAILKQSGMIQGEIASDYILNHPEVDVNGDGRIQYLVLEGENGHQDAIVRTYEVIHTMELAGLNMEKESYLCGSWSRDVTKTKMEQLIQGQNIWPEIIIGNNDAMTLGAIEAYASYEEKPVFIGIDGVAEGLKAVKNGDMIGTVYNNKEDQASNMLELAFNLAMNLDMNKLPLTDGKYLRSSYEGITINNVDEYLNMSK